LVSDLDHRDPRNEFEDIDTGKALLALSKLPQLTRMLVESNEWFVALDDSGRMIRLIRRRNDEMLQGSDPDETEFEFELDPEDALAPGRHVQLSSGVTGETESNEDELTESQEEANSEEVLLDEHRISSDWKAPRDRWDLIYDAEAEQSNGERGFSASVFPQIRWKGNGQSYLFKQLENRILFGSLPAGAFLFQQCQNLNPFERRRIWTLWYIQKAIREGVASVLGKKAAVASRAARTLSQEERERILNTRVAEIHRELNSSGE
jgi:hypothetical protein